MKNSIATIIIGIALVVLGSALAYHVFTTEIPKPTQQEAPAEAPVDSSWLWTDFSRPDTLSFLDKWTAKKPGVYFEAILTYHKNGIEALRVESEESAFLEDDGTRKIIQKLSYRSPSGFEIAYSYQKITYKQFLEGIAAPRVFKYDGWVCKVNQAHTKNPSACPEPSPETHVYNHNVKD